MDTQVQLDLAERVITTLRAHEPDLRRAGLRRLSVFGSVARGDYADESDIDLAVELDPEARMDFFRLVGIEMELAELLGRPVQLIPEPVRKARLQANIDRDRRRAF